MRTFHSSQYEVVGFGPVSFRGDTSDMWILRTRLNPKIPNFEPVEVIAKEAKYVDGGKTYFLKKGGRIEDALRELAYLPE